MPSSLRRRRRSRSPESHLAPTTEMLRACKLASVLRPQLLDGVRLPAAASARLFSTANVEEGLKTELLQSAMTHVPTLVSSVSGIESSLICMSSGLGGVAYRTRSPFFHRAGQTRRSQLALATLALAQL